MSQSTPCSISPTTLEFENQLIRSSNDDSSIDSQLSNTRHSSIETKEKISNESQQHTSNENELDLNPNQHNSNCFDSKLTVIESNESSETNTGSDSTPTEDSSISLTNSKSSEINHHSDQPLSINDSNSGSWNNLGSGASRAAFASALLRDTIQSRIQQLRQLDKSQLFRSFGSQPILSVSQLPARPALQNDESDSEEPLLSGSGQVSKDCPQELLEHWSAILLKWRKCAPGKRPNGLRELIKLGIPEALRGEVWQLLVMGEEDQGLAEAYRILITKESLFDQNIRRDINRTFPANEYFRNAGGIGQDHLYKLCKAYSAFDEQVGYCQGLTFIGAALLLHMPEEQAFVVLVKIMHDYGVSSLFRSNFEELHLRFFQLERLIEEQLPDLHGHFQRLGVQAHMYASQWFLTLFTAKFPLHLVYYILDLFLFNKFNTLFQVSLALLSLSQSDLLRLDFEGVLKYFRVQLPKVYRSDENARHLLKTALSIRLRKLDRFEKEYVAAQEAAQDPLQRLQSENQRLQESNLRLEQENDCLAHDLVNSKIALRKQLDVAEDKIDRLSRQMRKQNNYIGELEDEKRMLRAEVDSLKGLCRRELEQAETEINRNERLVTDYQTICAQLRDQLEKVTKRNLNEGDQSNGVDSKSNSKNVDLIENSLQLRVNELELELAQTKLALVEAECNNQTLMHKLNSKN